MKKIILSIVLSHSALLLNSQAFLELGFYQENGIFGINSKDSILILSNGKLIDNSNPSIPNLIGQFSFSGSLGIQVHVDESYGFFGTGMTSAIYIVDISNPSFPLQQSSIDFNLGNGVFGMDTQDRLLVAALGEGGIIASIDILDKNNPIWMDTLMISGGQCRDVCINEDYVYAAHAGGLKVIKIADVATLELIASFGSGYNSIALGDGRLFLGKDAGGVDVFSILNPDTPEPLFSIPNSAGTAWDLAYTNGLLYLATNSEGLFVYEIQSDSWELKANYPNTDNGQSFGVAIQDSLVMVCGLINGVATLYYDENGTVGMEDNNPIQSLHVYPNPTRGLLYFEGFEDEVMSIHIFSTNGSIIQQLITLKHTNTLNLDFLSEGIYVLRFESDRGVFYKRIIKTGN
jgi:hypothetical protein